MWQTLNEKMGVMLQGQARETRARELSEQALSRKMEEKIAALERDLAKYRYVLCLVDIR